MVERGEGNPLPEDNLQRERNSTESDLNRTAQPAGDSLTNANWYWYGCVAERREPNPHHWSQTLPQPGVLDLRW